MVATSTKEEGRTAVAVQLVVKLNSWIDSVSSIGCWN